MQDIGIVVEGPGDKLLFQALANWFQQRNIRARVTTAQNRSRLLRDASKHIQTHRLAGRSLVVLVIDQDQDHCPPTTAARLHSVRAADVLIVVVSRTLEAWLLADEHAVRSSTGGPYRQRGYTDDILDPVSRLKGVFYKARKQYLSKPEMTRALASHFSPTRGRQKNHSLARFVDRLP